MFRITSILSIACCAIALQANPFLDEAGVKTLSMEIEKCIVENAEDTQKKCIGLSSTPCLQTPDGQTTAGMMQCQYDESDAWDILLNHYYQITLKQVSVMEEDADLMFVPEGKPEDIYRDAQRAWLAFRDADVKKERLSSYGGSLSTVQAAMRFQNLTALRAIDLYVFCELYGTNETLSCLAYPSKH